jgi:hypothetical protein
MIRHLKNFNELIIYASLSTGLAFFVRYFPAFYFPVMLLRLAVVAYALFVIASIEHNRAFSYSLICSILLGLIGGYWDVIEINFTHNQSQVVIISSVISALSIAAIAVVFLRKNEPPK